MKMCPNCKVELHTKLYKGVKVDECENCKGMFFDKDELGRAKDNADPDTRWLDFVLFDIKDLATFSAEQKDCPKCSFAMDPLIYAGSQVVINRCPNCRGVWLDKGEFEKIIVYLERLVVALPSSELSDAVKRQAIDVLVGPKGEGEEVKDLVAVTRLLEERWVAEHPTIEKIIEMYYELTPFK